jgi:hypothetical protein
MLKYALILFMLLVFGKTFPQQCQRCTWLFGPAFLYDAGKPDTFTVLRYQPVKYYTGTDAQKRSADYMYLHNGDYWKGATNIFAGDELGPTWFKYLDIGQFASVIFDVGPSTDGHPKGAFQWGSKLLFFNTTKHRLGGKEE